MKLTKDLFGVRRGNVHPETIAAGEECPPELEDAARELGCFDGAFDPIDVDRPAPPVNGRSIKKRVRRRKPAKKK
jgi:hypothetical protein